MTKKLKDLVQAFKDARLDKATADDKRSILRQRLYQDFEANSDTADIYLQDYDDTYVYFEVYDWQEGGYAYWRVTYTFNGTDAVFGEDVEQVVRNTNYEVVETLSTNVEKSLLDKMSDLLDKHFNGSKQEVTEDICVIKVKDAEQMISVEPLYIAIDEVDGHGDAYANDQVAFDMCESFNKAVEEGRMQSGLFHKHLTKGFSPLRAWVTEEDEMIGETLVKAGQPLVEIQYHSEELWDLRKSGEIAGPSIGAKGSVEYINE